MPRYAIVHIDRRDRDFLWTWARMLADRTDLRVSPTEFIRVIVAALVDEWREARQQGKLFDTLTALETRVVRAAVEAEKECVITNRFARPDWVIEWNERIARPLGLKEESPYPFQNQTKAEGIVRDRYRVPGHKTPLRFLSIEPVGTPVYDIDVEDSRNEMREFVVSGGAS